MEEIQLLNEAIILVFFEHKISLASKNYGWRHMDYFNNVLTTFLGLERGGSLAVNILICIPKMSKGLTGLEWHEGE